MGRIKRCSITPGARLPIASRTQVWCSSSRCCDDWRKGWRAQASRLAAPSARLLGSGCAENGKGVTDAGPPAPATGRGRCRQKVDQRPVRMCLHGLRGDHYLPALAPAGQRATTFCRSGHVVQPRAWRFFCAPAIVLCGGPVIPTSSAAEGRVHLGRCGLSVSRHRHYHRGSQGKRWSCVASGWSMAGHAGANPPAMQKRRRWNKHCICRLTPDGAGQLADTGSGDEWGSSMAAISFSSRIRLPIVHGTEPGKAAGRPLTAQRAIQAA